MNDNQKIFSMIFIDGKRKRLTNVIYETFYESIISDKKEVKK